MTRKVEALDGHLERALAAAGFWGEADCYLWPADWVVLSGWPDPAFPHRGRYRTALGAARIVGRAGGPEALWIAGAAQSGLAVTTRPIAGDVGLVHRATTGTGPALRDTVGAICLGAGEWAVSTPTGLRQGRWPVIRSWRLPWRTR